MNNVSNRQVINLVAKNTFRANRIRNTFALIAIALTTVLFTSLFTIGTSLMKSIEQTTMRTAGGSAHGTFKSISQDQFDRLKNHPLIKDIEPSYFIVFLMNRELTKRPAEIRYGTDQNAEWRFAKPTTGDMPDSYNEIATDTLVLDHLGIPHEIGQTVTLEYKLAGEIIAKQFVLSGFWEGDRVILGSTVWVSKDFFEEIWPRAYQDSDGSIGSLSADVMFNTSVDLEGKFKKVITDSGFGVKDIDFGVNWAYISTSKGIDFETILSLSSYILVFVLCGYLMIYNIFYIYVSRDVRFFGLLKSIGTTTRQIRQMINKQSIWLCVVGIPIGMVFGYLSGSVLTPVVLADVNIAAIEISANPFIFIGSALFAGLTVFMSTRAPINLASKVSMIEAIKTSDVAVQNKTRNRINPKFSLSRLAIANVLRNSRKALLVTASLSLSLIIFNFTVVTLKSFDLDSYLKKMVSADFLISDAAIFNWLTGFSGQPTLASDVLKEIAAQGGIEDLGLIRLAENDHKLDSILTDSLADIAAGDWADNVISNARDAIKNGFVLAHVYGIDPIVQDTLKIHAGSIDYDKFSTGKYVIVSAFADSANDDEIGEKFYEVGDQVTLPFAEGVKKEYEVMAIASLPYNLTVRHSHLINPDFLIPNDEFIRQVGEVAPMHVMVNTYEDSTPQFDAWLNNYCDKIHPDLNYESRDLYKDEFASYRKTFMSVFLVITAIVTFVGIMNFINTMVTSILSRHHELAVMQSIGMTNQQLRLMLIWEGLTYALLTTAFVLTIGVVLTHFGVSAISKIVWFFNYQFTMEPLFFSIPFLLLLAVMVPVGCYAYANKESVVERLREIE